MLVVTFYFNYACSELCHIKRGGGGCEGGDSDEWMNEWIFNDTQAQSLYRLLGVREIHKG